MGDHEAAQQCEDDQACNPGRALLRTSRGHDDGVQVRLFEETGNVCVAILGKMATRSPEAAKELRAGVYYGVQQSSVPPCAVGITDITFAIG